VLPRIAQHRFEFLPLRAQLERYGRHLYHFWASADDEEDAGTMIVCA
jgi:hypothetical protein